jgi:glycerol-3-phosphate cytidylyltransferase
MEIMKRVLTYGTFDMFHIGHLNLLKRAKQLGDELYVGVSTDEFNKLKNKVSLMPYKDRAEIVRSVKYVDFVFPEKDWNQKIEDIKKYKIDTFVMGSDWKGKFDFLKDYCDVIYLERTENISTTLLKDRLIKYLDINVENLKKLKEEIEKLIRHFE